jgi:cell division protein ZapA
VKDKDFKINIKIDGRTYPLNINRDEEEKYRKAAKVVNEIIDAFRHQFRNNDQQDIMAMAAYEVALRYVTEQQGRDYSQFIDDIKDLNDDISDFLKDE